MTDYHALYAIEAEKEKIMWAKTWDPALEADVWYNRNRNDICLDMLGELCKDKRLLSIGGRSWVESEFLEKTNAETIIKTDIVGDPEENVLEADAHNLPFPDNSFDIVSCRDMIEHVENAQGVLLECKRVLRTGGYLLITTPNIYNLPIDGVIHIRGYTPESLLTELAELGFEVIDKRGNAPNMILVVNMYRKGFGKVLEEQKRIDKMVSTFPYSYYIGTQLFVLAVKL
jgi:SAM-dependent methyltransferase